MIWSRDLKFSRRLLSEKSAHAQKIVRFGQLNFPKSLSALSMVDLQIAHVLSSQGY